MTIINIFFRSEMVDNMFTLSLPAIIVLSLITVIVLVIVIKLCVKALKSDVTTGFEGMVGTEAVALEDFQNNKGNILVSGEIWTGISEDDVKKDNIVVIMSAKGMKLTVKNK